MISEPALSILVFILMTLLCVALVTILIISLLFVGYSLRADAPFVKTRKKAIEDAVKLLKLNSSSVLYDLGCGDGHVLLQAMRTTPDAIGVGIEKNIIVFLYAKWRTRGLPITIRNEDIFATNIKNATHIYCYLYPSVLEKLAPKILAECQKGTRIVTCDFQFPSWKPAEHFKLDAKKYQMAKDLYVYIV